MTLTLEEISDRLEIQDTLLAYSTALDVPGRRWDQWYKCFTPDAVCEYPTIGPKSPAELQELFSLNDAVRLTTQHLFLNIVIAIDGDTATVRSECSYAAVNRGETAGKNTLRLSGLWFDDALVRTGDGWRIRHRVANSRWSHAIEIDAA
jgi:SnoaL-like domain